MIIIEVAGGLGNQLQQYALYKKFQSLGKEARLDISWFREENQSRMLAKRELELNYFEGLDYKVCTPKEKAKLAGGSGIAGKLRRKLLPFTIHHITEERLYHPELLSYSDMYISGYFDCEKYYADILPKLRESIRFPKGGSPQNQELAEEMQSCNSVSMHIRRGDYLDENNREMFGGICTEEYYEQAIKMIKEEVPDARFYIFSDDAAYVKGKYQGEDYTVVDINHGRDSFYDIWLMSNCRHNICANSTFSFWGARLNENEDKIMIRPTIHKNSQIFVKKEMEELWRGWRFINPKGQIQ